MIVATGGFGNNTKMIEQFLGFKWGEDMFTFRIPGIDGEGMRMVWDVGGKRSNINMEVTYNTPGTTMSYAINSGRIAGMERVDYMDSDRFVE